MTVCADLLGQGSPQISARQFGGALGWQRDVAEDDADAPAIQVVRDGRGERLPSDVQRQMKDGIELRQQLGGQVESIVWQWDVVEKIASQRVDAIGPSDGGVVGVARIEQPAFGRRVAGSVGGGQDLLPQTFGTGRTGEQPAPRNNGYPSAFFV